uniref:ATP synthase F0 subunit 8 n=1 Tax=Bradysia odoriphaga TaxID=1564500 RepID=UPI001FA749E6|nr:ATP synthase F0 subunit 8 [Bradysia odoriphaga]UMY76232.1 ATP synthase F0 subunit 8 [Bradysia odoriphaga]
MPQMAPINWLSLFIMMCMTFLLFNLINYFTFKINNNNIKFNNIKENNNHNNLKNNFMWKW